MLIIETIALSLIKSLSSFLFSKMLAYSNVNVQGAPSWYYQEESSYVCVSDYSRGDMGSVDNVKSIIKGKLNDKVKEIMEIVVYDNFRDNNDKTEKALIYQFINDENLYIFINKNVDFKNIEYIKKYSTTFGRGCIEKSVLMEYEKERIGKIKNGLSHKRANDAFKELDSNDTDDLDK